MGKRPATVRLSEVADIYDGPHATPRKTAAGPWFLSISSLSNGRLKLAESAHLSEDDFVKWTRRVTPREGDVLFSYETRLGEAAMMPAGLTACLGRRMGLLRPKQVNPRFLLYAYLGPEFQSEIRRRTVSGATVERIPLNELGEWPITIPDRCIQDGVADVLGALDDKIDGNQLIIEVCMSLGAVLFKRAATEVASVAELATITMGQSPPGSTYNELGDGLPFYQGTRDFGLRSPRRRVWCTSPNRIGEPGDVLVSVRAPVGRSNVARERCVIGRGLAALRSKYGAILFQSLCADPAVWSPFEGGGTVFGAINKEQLAELLVPTVPAASRDELEQRLSALDAKIGAAERESRVLSDLRDALLPALLTGEMSIRDVRAAPGGSA